VAFVGLQVDDNSHGLEGYHQRRETLAEHQERIRAYLDLRRLGPTELEELAAFMFEMACQLEHAADLQAKAKEFLREHKILIPADTTLTRIVGEHRERARQQIFRDIAEAVPKRIAHTLDDLLVIDRAQAVSPLQRIKENPSKPSAGGMQALIDKLTAIERTGVLRVDISWLSRNYQRALFHYARKASADRLRDLARTRRHATLVCFLWQSYSDAVDQAVDMFDKLLTRTASSAQKKLDEQMIRQRKLVRNSLSALRTIGCVLLDESVDDAHVRSTLFERVSKETLSEYVDDVEQWVTGKNSDPRNSMGAAELET